jgi:photosystem II stability/assembly factor-like uncharacterized protein
MMRRLIVVLAVAGNCFGQPLTWQDLSGASGYDTIMYSSTGRLFATNHRGVIYESADRGISFQSILAFPSSTTILQLAVNGDRVATRLSDPDVGARYQLFSWNGVPNDWTRILATSFRFIQALMISDSGVVFGVDPYGNRDIVRWTGSSWIPVGPSQSFLSAPSFAADLDIVTAVDHSNNLVVGSRAGGVYVSADEGQSWGKSLSTYPVSTINVTLPGTILVGTIPSPTPPLNTFGGIFESTDNGGSWRGLGLSNHLITCVAARSSGELWALADGAAYRRDNSSGVWDLVSPAGRVFTTLVLIGTDTTLLSSEAAGTQQSQDDGASWTGSDIRGKDVFTIAAAPSGTLLTGTLGSGVFKSAPNGVGWTQLPADVTGDYIYSIAPGGGSIYAGSERGVSRTTDEGASWLNLTPFSGSAYSVATTPDGNVFAGTGFGVYRSADSGATWVPSGLSASKVFYLTSAPGGALYAGTARDGVYESADGGTTWASRGLIRNDIQTLAVNSVGHLFAGVYGGVFRSTDEGATWVNASFVNGYVYTLLPSGAQALLAGTNGGIYRSSDEGATWSAAGDSGLEQHFVLSLFQDADNRVLAGTYRGTVYRSVRPVVSPTVSSVLHTGALPVETRLSQNYPNPFNPKTEIRYQIGAGSPGSGLASGPAFVNLRIYDLAGEEISVLVNERKYPGTYTASWDAGNRPSGVYFYQLRVVDESRGPGEVFFASKKLLLIR